MATSWERGTRVVRAPQGYYVRDRPWLQSSYLPSLEGQMLKHGAWLGETAGVPGEVPLAISMLNVQPDDIAGQVVIIKALIDFLHIGFIPVVPAALVVAEGEERGQCLGPCRFSEGRGGHSGIRPTWGQWGHPEIEGGL